MLSVSQLVDCRSSSSPERGYLSAVTPDTPDASVAVADSPAFRLTLADPPSLADPLTLVAHRQQFARFRRAFDAGSAFGSDRAGRGE